MCGFIAQLVEHRTAIGEVTGSKPGEALNFFQSSFFAISFIPISLRGSFAYFVPVLLFFSRPTYRYSQLSQDDDDDLEGSETFKYNPRPKGLRAYRDYDTSDDVSSVDSLRKFI